MPKPIENQQDELEPISNIRKLAKMLDSKQLLDTEDLKNFVSDIVGTFARYISSTKEINADTKKVLNEALVAMRDAHNELLDTVDQKDKDNLETFDKKLSDAIKNFSQKVEEMASMLPENGADADEEAIIAKLHEMLKTESVEETPITLRDKLETLEGEERIDKSAVKGIDEWMEKVQGIIQQMTFGRRGGNTNGGGVQSVISSDGSVEIVSSGAKGKGVVDLSISVSGYTILTTVSTIDDSNMAFVFASKPVELVVNGISYRENHGWTWSAGPLTATLTGGPVGTGGDIYGRK